jgi:hypothetical protein
MLVGEIGIDRNTFFNDLRWWEVKAIIRGYNARHHHGWEQARLIAYNAHYCMGSKNPVPVVTEWLPFPWEKKAVQSSPLSDEERNDLQAEMAAMNEELRNKD